MKTCSNFDEQYGVWGKTQTTMLPLDIRKTTSETLAKRKADRLIAQVECVNALKEIQRIMSEAAYKPRGGLRYIQTEVTRKKLGVITRKGKALWIYALGVNPSHLNDDAFCGIGLWLFMASARDLKKYRTTDSLRIVSPSHLITFSRHALFRMHQRANVDYNTISLSSIANCLMIIHHKAMAVNSEHELEGEFRLRVPSPLGEFVIESAIPDTGKGRGVWVYIKTVLPVKREDLE